MVNVVQGLTGSTFVTSEPENSIRFPLEHGHPVSISSDEITDESIAEAKAKLTKEKDQLEQIIAQQQKVIHQMTGKAPSDKIKDKENIVSAQKNRLKEIDKTLQLLD